MMMMATTTKGEETKRNILEHCLSVSSQIGLEGLSIGSVAKDVGMSKSGLFAHFDSKEDLQVQVIRTAVDHFIAEVVMPALRQPRGEPRIRAMFTRWLEWGEKLPGGCPFVSASAEMDDRPGPVRDLLASSQKDWMASLATATRIAQEEGQFKADLDPQQVAFELNAIFLAHHHGSRLLRDDDSKERVRRSFENLIARYRA